jgi:hypothetical protein
MSPRAASQSGSNHRPIPKPSFRDLRVFAFDPSRGKNFGNEMTLQVPFEDSLEAGPVGRYMAVVDYDSARGCYYEPVNLNDPWILAQDGLQPSEADPRFHQQMVYSVVSDTIHRFEYALGRRIHWRRDGTQSSFKFHKHLLVLPHGIQEANAFYDPEIHALVFGYFTASAADIGRNIPGQVVFTCLAHDVVAHECTHALLDGIRPQFMEPTNDDVAAFHEGFADIVALLQHFSNNQAVLEALRGTGGLLYRPELSPEVKPRTNGANGAPAVANGNSGNEKSSSGALITAEEPSDNPVFGLAKQFGDAIGLHGPLRVMIGTPPDPTILATKTEPHDRGSVLVAAIFDAFFKIFLNRTRDLWRIAGLSRDGSDDICLHPDLLARLVDEAARTAGHFETLCIRALDYCPPVDMTFGDYLRALITADRDAVRDDDLGYRAALIDGFASRGIQPEGVASDSEESLLWRRPEFKQPLQIKDLPLMPPNATDEERHSVLRACARILHAFAIKHASAFGLNGKNARHISVESFHYVTRPSPDAELPRPQMIAVIVERQPGNRRSQPDAIGGVTLVLEPDGRVRYAITKSLLKGRAQKQAEFRQQLWDSTPEGAYTAFAGGKINFRALHGRF